MRIEFLWQAILSTRGARCVVGTVCVSLLLSGCAATTTLKNPNVAAPPASSAVLLMKPDVQLSELTAG